MARENYKKDKHKSPGIAKKQIIEDSTTGSSQITEGQPSPDNNPGKNMDYDKAKGIHKGKEKNKKSDSGKNEGKKAA